MAIKLRASASTLGALTSRFSGAAASFFRDYASSDYARKYQPRFGGPLCDAGADYTPMAAFDLTGSQARKIGPRIDIGCYEGVAGNTMLLVW